MAGTVVIGGENRSQPPYVLRGYKFNDGGKFPGMCFCVLICTGVSVVFVIILCKFVGASLFRVSSGPVLEVFIGLFAAVLWLIGCYFCVGARSQYHKLPHDHPDRYKYGSGYVLRVLPPQPAAPPATNNTLTTYNFSHGAQGRGSANPSPRPYRGASTPYQGPSKGNPPPSPSAPRYDGQKTSPRQYDGASTSFQGPPTGNPPLSPTAPQLAAEDDLPPSYAEIEKNNPEMEKNNP